MAVLLSKPAPNPVQIYSICDLQEHDMDNILIGLAMLMERLEKKSIQRIQADELHHTLIGQRKLRQKEALTK